MGNRLLDMGVHVVVHQHFSSCRCGIDTLSSSKPAAAGVAIRYHDQRADLVPLGPLDICLGQRRC